jgi:hypothetical protein
MLDDAGAGAGAGGGSGTATPAFAETLPADLRGDPAFKDIKDLPGLAKSYVNAQKMIGLPADRRLALPAGDDPKEWAEVFARLGRPEGADKYQIPKRGDNKDYSPADVEFQKAILPVLHEAGLSQRQLNVILPKWNEMMDGLTTKSEQAATAARADAEAKLKTELGAAYQEKVGLARNAFVHYAEQLKLGDGIVAAFDKAGMGNDPAVIKLFAHLGEALKEDPLHGKNFSGSGDTLSPAEAEQQIRSKYADKAFMKVYGDKRAPGHAEAVQAMAKLFEMKAAAAA